jgi:hypothetical protein
VGRVDLNKPRIRAALSAVLALAAATGGFTVAEFTAKAHAMTGNTGYTVRQAAYDLRKLRKELIVKPGRTRRYHLEPRNAGTVAALLALREQVIEPIRAGGVPKHDTLHLWLLSGKQLLSAHASCPTRGRWGGIGSPPRRPSRR